MRKEAGNFLPVLAVIVILVLAGGLYFFTANKFASPLITPPPNQSTTSTPNQTSRTVSSQPIYSITDSEDKNWKVFHHNEGEFSFKFPASWVHQYEVDNGFIELNDDKPFGQGIKVRTYPNTSYLNEKDFLYTYGFYGQDYDEPSIEALGDLLGVNTVATKIKANGVEGEEMGIMSRAGGVGDGAWFHNGGMGIYLLFSGSTNSDADKDIKSKIYKTFQIDKKLSADSGLEVVFDRGDIVTIENGVRNKLTSYGHNYNPTLSPNRKMIAYVSVPNEVLQHKEKLMRGSNVWVIGSDGTHSQQVTTYIPDIERRNLFWLNDDQLLYSDGSFSLKIYSVRKNVSEKLWGETNATNCPSYSAELQNGQKICNYNPRFYFSPDNRYLIAMQSSHYKTVDTEVGIINLKTLQTKSIKLTGVNFLDRFSDDNSQIITVSYTSEGAAIEKSLSLDI